MKEQASSWYWPRPPVQNPLDSPGPAEKRTGGDNLGPILFEQRFIKLSALFNIYIGASEASETL